MALTGWLGACSTQSSDGDSESHFLALCVSHCGGGLDCICGVCTRACVDDATCKDLNPRASCIDDASCLHGASRTCGATCATNVDCATIPGTTCDDGVCRAGLGDAGPNDASQLEDHSVAPDASRIPPLPDASRVRPLLDGSRGLPDATPVPPLPDASRGLPDATPVGQPDGGARLPIVFPDGGDSCDLGNTIEWRRVGGFSVGGDTHRLARGELPEFRSTAYTLTTSGGIGCQVDLPCGGAGINMLDVNRVLARDDVRAAFEGAPRLYGVDRTPVDGSVEAVSVDGWTVSIGDPCRGASGCVDAPSGVVALLDVLHRIDAQERAPGACGAPQSCYAPPDPGPCSGSFVRFAYDPRSGVCKAFTYGGCNGSGENRYDSKAACEQGCAFDACRLGAPLNADAGGCSGSSDLLSTSAGSWCFSDRTAACDCACAVSGGSVTSCTVSGRVATCPLVGGASSPPTH